MKTFRNHTILNCHKIYDLIFQKNTDRLNKICLPFYKDTYFALLPTY